MFVVLMTVLRSTVSQARVQSSKGSQPRKIVLTISQEVVQGTVEDLDEPELEQAQPPGVLGEDEQIVDDSDSDAEFGIAGPSEDVSPGVRERLAKERRALAKGETAGGGSGAGSSSKARKREASGSPEESKGKGKVQRKGKGGRGADDDNDDEEMLV